MSKTKTKGKFNFNFKITIILCCLIPMFVGIVASLAITLTNASNELKTANKNAIMSLTQGVGEGLDDHVEASEKMLRAFASSAEVKNYLKKPSSLDLADECQKFTEDFFANLDEWEGLYIANWDSTVMTHSSNPDIIGVTLREGDALDELHNAMLSSDTGLYNAGVITSPSSGKLTLSMYCVVYDNDKPIGYVGGAIFLSEAISDYSDVSILNLPSAYLYAVDSTGTMIYHKDESKVGNPVENEVVKGLVADIQAGKHPTPAIVTYKYKGAEKLAGYYINSGDNFISVVTCDMSDISNVTKHLLIICLSITIVLVIIFTFIAIIVAKAIAKPLADIVAATEDLANGYIHNPIEIHSIMKETKKLVNAATLLQSNLQGIVDNVRDVSNTLVTNIEETNSLCGSSADGAGQISSVVEELATASQSMAESVQNLASNMNEIAADIDRIDTAVDALNASSKEMNTIAEEAKTDIISVNESSELSVKAAEDIANHMTELSKAINEVSEATKLINDISSQTNLLSLNASIEAARAGEAGRGFAVVAQEIGSLATQSANSASQIDTIANNIIKLSEVSAKLTEDIKGIITDQQAKVSKTQDSFLKLKDEIDISIQQIANIAEESANLNVAKDNANNSVQDLSAISEENAASNEEVTASVAGLSSNITDIADRSNDLTAMTGTLTESLSAFKD